MLEHTYAHKHAHKATVGRTRHTHTHTPAHIHTHTDTNEKTDIFISNRNLCIYRGKISQSDTRIQTYTTQNMCTHRDRERAMMREAE